MDEKDQQTRYYDLVKVTLKRGVEFHIPVPIVLEDGNKERANWLDSLSISPIRRNGEYYTCLVCKERNYYSGLHQWCAESLSDDELDENKAREDLCKKMGKELLQKIDNGEDLGIEKAEVIIADPPWV